MILIKKTYTWKFLWKLKRYFENAIDMISNYLVYKYSKVMIVSSSLFGFSLEILIQYRSFWTGIFLIVFFGSKIEVNQIVKLTTTTYLADLKLVTWREGAPERFYAEGWTTNWVASSMDGAQEGHGVHALDGRTSCRTLNT